MHISESRESPNIILTKCAKMNENSHKKLGINGNSEGTVLKVKEEYPKNYYAPSTSGGRLKFFKDGKFILELERAKEGERVSWVSVPRKTFWPPQGVATTVTCKQEGSTSLSISDDNSSIQSSPWQRDHFWKQTNPRRNLSKEMCFYYVRSKNSPVFLKSNKARRPYSTEPENDSPQSDSSDQKTDTNMCNKFNNCKKRRSLLVIVQDLVDKNVSKSPLRIETVVSPRKRFLREMEKDRSSLEDNNLKRSKNKITSNQASPLRTNGHAEEKQVVAPSTIGSTKNCSYSITSLLSDDRAPAKRSPNNSPSHFMPVTTSSVASQINFNMAAVKTEDPWYSESVERFRSIELSHADKSSFHSFPHPSYMPPFVYPYSFPACYGYGRGFPSLPMYSPAHHLPVSMMRQEAPSCSWKTDRPAEGEAKKEENNLSDMPLNLSKHAG